MKLEEYKQKLKEIDQKAEKDKTEVAVNFCKSNNPYKIGDTVTDHIGSMIIERIGFYITREQPCCIYYGTEITNKGVPNKKQSGRGLYQSNLINNLP